jgi:hypothetical protein
MQSASPIADSRSSAAILAAIESLTNEVRELRERLDAKEKLFYTEAEFAGMVGKSVRTIQDLRLAGKIPYKRVARKVLYTRAHLEEFLSGRN